MEQTKAQEVTLKDAIEGPSAGDGQKEKEQRALIKAGEILLFIPSPTPSEVQEWYKGPANWPKPSRSRFCCA